MAAGSKITSYRIYCRAPKCGAETVLHDDELDASEWTIASLHFHEGYCPEHNRAGKARDETEAVELGSDQCRLDAYLTSLATDGGESR